jgi:phosphoribosylformylglycinamidine (FGAM) synthase-like amidotransferase family enzyme
MGRLQKTIMIKKFPKVIVLSGYGLNCEEETAFAFTLAGAKADIVHINDLADRIKKLKNYQILAIPGGFSYGDDTGSGKAYANKLKNHLKKELDEFVQKDKLTIGICNGFQILTNLGLLPGVLTFNDNARYTDRWVDVCIPQPVIARSASDEAIFSKNKIASVALAMTKVVSPWLTGIDHLSLPIAHGEGKFMAGDETLSSLKKQKMIAGVYYKGEMCNYQNLTPNPNGSTLDIAMLTSANGKILGTMPHPERAMFFTQAPNWPLLKEQLIRAGKPLPKYGPGLQIFKNAVSYFK